MNEEAFYQRMRYLKNEVMKIESVVSYEQTKEQKERLKYLENEMERTKDLWRTQ